MSARKLYPTNVSDEAWGFVPPYLSLLPADAGQRRHELRAVFNALRWIVRAGAPWRMLPTNFPPWEAVYQQTQRWLAAGVFEALVHDLRVLRRLAEGRAGEPRERAPGRRRRGEAEAGLKVHLAVDTLGHLLAPQVTPATEQDRAQVAELAAQVQAATGEHVALAYVDQGYTGVEPAADAAAHGLSLEVVRHAAVRRGVVLLPRRWVVERSFARPARFRRLARDYERLPRTVAGLHFVAFACLRLHRAALALGAGP